MATGAASSRRSVLSVLAASALPRVAVAQAAAPWRAGLQLWTVRDLLAADRDGTLRRVAEIGYRSVELAGLDGGTTPDWRASLQRYGIAVPSIHASYERLDRDLGRLVSEAHLLGAEFVVCPSIDPGPGATADAWRRAGRSLGRIGRMLRGDGLSLAYHNHDFEFAPLSDGSVPFDLMMRETDPRDLGLELDVYWLAKAGRDPVQCLNHAKGRVQLLHLKDLGADGTTVELGRGTLDMEAIIRTSLAAEVTHLFVEQDDSADPLASVRTSYRFLAGLPQDVRPQ